MSAGGLSLVDYIIFVAVIIMSISIGIYYACTGDRQSTTMQYHLGNRRMKVIPTALSLFVTTQSSIMMVGFPAEAYLYGIVVIWLGVAFFLCHLIGTRIVIPMIHPLKLTTVNELRYNSKVTRTYMAVCMIVMNVLYMGVIIYGQAASMDKVTGIPSWASVLILTSAAICYTSIGGIQAVIWTDVFQCCIMFFGVVSVLIKGTGDAGGPLEVLEINKESGKLNIFEASFDPLVQYTVWSQCIGGTAKFMYYLIRQTSAQRINSCASQNDAKKMHYISGCMYIVSSTLGSMEGLVMFAYFTKRRCDPIRDGRIANPNQLLPLMVVEIFKAYPGISGLFFASVTCANLSSISSCLSSMSSITYTDMLKPNFPAITDMQATTFSKIAVVVYGVISIALCFAISHIKGTILKIILNVCSLVGIPITSIYIYSVFCRSARQMNLFIGVVISSCCVLWINIGEMFYSTTWQAAPPHLGPNDMCERANDSKSNNFTMFTTSVTHLTRPVGLEALYSVSTFWFDIIGIGTFFLVVSTVHFIADYACKTKQPVVKEHLVFSILERFCPCFLKNLRQTSASYTSCDSSDGHDNIDKQNQPTSLTLDVM